jgi:hypothetical protein
VRGTLDHWNGLVSETAQAERGAGGLSDSKRIMVMQKEVKKMKKKLEIKGIDPFASSLRTTRSTM